MRLVKLFVIWFGLLAGMAVAQAPAPGAPPAPDPQNILHLELSTGGEVVILMRPDKAPQHVERIRTLARAGFCRGFYRGRLVPRCGASGGNPD